MPAENAVPVRSRDTLRRGLVLLTLCLGVLIAQIDTSVVNLAVQPIGRSFSANVPTLQWVVDGYNLPYALFLLTGGLLADLYGRRRTFVAGVLVFSAGCLVCGLAPSSGALIVGRVVSGLGAALLLPASLAILRVVWTDRTARGHALGVWAGCNGLAFAVGPTLGGVLIACLGWRSVFLRVLPPATWALLRARRAAPDAAAPPGRRFDLAGQALGAIALGGFALAAIEGRSHPGALAVALPAALAGAALFVTVERRRGETALVPLTLFRQRAFVGAVTATTSMTFGMYGLIFLLPLAWQTGANGAAPLAPVAAGLSLAPMALAFALLSGRSGALTERFGARTMAAGGTALIGVGLWVASLTAAGRPMWLAQVGLLLSGLGMGTNSGPLLGVAVASAPVARSGTASALINVARMAGATLGVALLGTIFAACDGGSGGLRAALFVGGAVQLVGATVAWASIGEAARQ